jgi:hypothetical protein
MATTRRRASPPSPEVSLRKRAQKMSVLALETLGKIMEGEGQTAVQLAAAREVLDRGYGRPKLGAASEGAEGMTVIVKQFTDVTAQDEAEADATEAMFR